MNIFKKLIGINILKTDTIKMKISKSSFNGVCLVIMLFNLGASISYWFYVPHSEQIGLLFTFLLGFYATVIYVIIMFNKNIYNEHEILLKRMIIIGLFAWLFYETNIVGGFFYKSLEMIFIIYILIATSLLDSMYISLGLIGGSLVIIYHIILLYMDIRIPIYVMRLLKINPLDYKAEVILFWLMFLSIGIVIIIFTKRNKKYFKIIEKKNAKNKYEIDVAKEIIKYSDADIPENLKKHYNISIYQEAYYEISGDLYFITEIKNKYYIFLLDICGHGLEAAMFTLMLKKELYRLREDNIKNTAVNFTHAVEDFLERTDKSTTITAVELDPKTGVVKYINNGNSMFIYGKHYCKMLQNSGFGLTYNYSVMEENIKNKTLILSTDGLIESANKNNEQYGVDRIIDTISQGGNILENLVVKYNNHISKKQDDVTIIVIEDAR